MIVISPKVNGKQSSAGVRKAASGALKLSVYLFWAVAIVLPMISMLSNIAHVDVARILSSRTFVKALRQSITVSSLATAISVSWAALLAWCITRTRIRYRGLLTVLFALPMLIPSISHGMGMIILFGSNGILHNLLGLSGTIYGFWGIVTGSVMYSFPVAFLMLYDVLRYEDSTPYEAAQVLGIPVWNRFTAITLPYLRKPLISVVFATFAMIVTDYGVPLMIGGKYSTLPVVMYQDVIGMLDFGKGSLIGLILLAPALVACILDILNRDRGNAAFVTKPFELKPSRIRDGIAVVVSIFTGIAIILPIGMFAYISVVGKYPVDMSFSLANIAQALDMHVGTYLRNSLLIAVFVAVLGTALATFLSYLTARTPSKDSKLLHLLSISSLAVPGIVLGLSYILFFKGTLIYGTFAILILVNMMHFFSSPYLMMYNTFGKLNPNLEAVGATLGISRLKVFRDVLLPQSSGTILEMLSYFFVNSMMTISAVSFLATVSIKPVALMITQFEGQMQLESAAFVSVIILLINMAVKAAVYLIKRGITKKST